MDEYEELLSRVKRLEQAIERLSTPWGPISLTTALAETGGSLAGAALNVGTYTVGPTGGGATYSYAYPSNAKSLDVYMSAAWASAATASFAYLRPNGGTSTAAGVTCNAMVAAFYDRQYGKVSLDSSGLAQLLVVNANTTGLYLYILGYSL